MQELPTGPKPQDQMFNEEYQALCTKYKMAIIPVARLELREIPKEEPVKELWCTS